MEIKENAFIDLNLYNIFYTVYKQGSFSKAAEKLYVTQPAISYSIKKLEEILGITLFIREKNNLRITEDAKEIIPYVEEALTNFKIGKQKIEEKLNLRNTTIKIGVPSHIGIFLLVDTIKEFSKKFENTNIKVECKTTKELIKLLENNKVDLIIDSSPIEKLPSSDYIIKKISEEKYCFACNKVNEELLKEKLNLGDLAKLDLIIPAISTSAAKELENIFETYNVKFNPKYEISTSEIIVEMVLKDIGIGYLYERTINRYKDIKKIKIIEKLPSSEIFLIYKKKSLSNSAKEFIKNISNSKNNLN